MSTLEDTSTNIAIKEFNALKQVQFFDGLKHIQLSGHLFLEDRLGQQWTFYLYLGRVLYATGGTHAVRRWRRNLALYCPGIDTAKLKELCSLSGSELEAFQECWEYQTLCLWVEKRYITREQAARMIWSAMTEVLFDITQVRQVDFLVEHTTTLSTQLVLIDVGKLITDVQQKWEKWQDAKVADRSPNRAPLIKQPERLQQQTSPATYQTLTKLLDGKQTLRDLAVQRKRDVLDIATTLLPYMQAGLVELVDVPDLSSPFPNLSISTSTAAQVTTATAVTPIIPTALAVPEVPKGPLIACVDDSPLVCQTMEKIMVAGGYQFLGVQDPLRAIATLLSRRPDLIFLDLVMPNTNGYEICAQLRKVSLFKTTPIVILTGNDGVLDRVRAKLVGSTDFLGKPVDADTVLTTVHKYLKHQLKSNSLVVG
ncbi:MAG: response regulator [Leptolyngbyaceae bacterium]|nr:response regulator [Leptolyngbyaceae bacterium]